MTLCYCSLISLSSRPVNRALFSTHFSYSFSMQHHTDNYWKKITTAAKLKLGAGKRGIIFVAIIKKTRTVTYKNVVLLSNRQHGFYLKQSYALSVMLPQDPLATISKNKCLTDNSLRLNWAIFRTTIPRWKKLKMFLPHSRKKVRDFINRIVMFPQQKSMKKI